MNIIVKVVNQLLEMATNLKTLVAGSQEFIRFVFRLPSDWEGLSVVALFIQNGVPYLETLDNENSVYLPPLIVPGNCILVLFGSGGDVRATTNYLSLHINQNMLMDHASEVQLTQSAYAMIVQAVTGVSMTQQQYEALILDDITNILEAYRQAGVFDTVVLEDGTVSRSKVDADFEATLQKADSAMQYIPNGSITRDMVSAEINEILTKADTITDSIADGSIARSKVDSSFEATLQKADNAMQPSVYDLSNRRTDVYTYADNAANAVQSNLTTTNSNLTALTSEVNNAKTVDSTTYNTLGEAVSGALSKAKTYTDNQLSAYVPYTITVVNALPAQGADRTFYLIPKTDNQNNITGYEKWWYITNASGSKVWDEFGGSSTVVVSTLPNQGEADVDYILNTNGEYSYYKWINNGWHMIAGGGGEVITANDDGSIIMFGVGTPAQNELDAEDFVIDNVAKSYLNTTNFGLWTVTGTNTWEQTGVLVASPSTNKDYYIKDTSGNWAHFRYISNAFQRIAVDAYSRAEIDAMLTSQSTTLTGYVDTAVSAINEDIGDILDDITSINETISSHTQSISDINDDIVDINSEINTLDGDIDVIDAKVDALGNLVSDITEISTGIQVVYKDGTTKNVSTKDNTVTVEDVRSNANGITIEYTDGTTNDIEIQGGGGGGTSSGSASITRVTDASTQCVYGDDCNITYSFEALDSAGDAVGSGSATWYVGNIRRATSTANQGQNTFNIGPYLSVGQNNIRLSITVDTGGETPITTTKTWTVNAINLYATWDYDDATINTSDTVAIRWTPYGDLSKTTHIIIDGVERQDLQTVTTRSGVQQFVTMNRLSHGSHMVELYLTATVNNTQITSESIFHDMIFVDSASNVPVISSSLSDNEVIQYNTLRIPLVIYTPSSLTSTAVLAVDGTEVATWTDVDRTVHNWNYTPNTAGTKTLTITSGVTTKTLTIIVNELDIDNEEVSGYTFRMKASDITGNEALRAWSSNGVTATFSNNFDWNNGGIQTETDENDNLRQFICVKAGTRMTINHKLFADDPTIYGKTFKIIFKARNCRDYDASVAQCYTNGVGLQLSAHNAQFSSTGTSVSVPYGEDEYIELEFDVYPTPTANNGSHRYIMAWIDGVITTCRVYGDSDNFTHPVANQQDIVIGSDDCDVYIYMIKAYPNYMTRDNHITNFISDAPNAQEMVARYNRNDIMNSSGTEIDYEKLIQNNPDCRVWLYDIPYMTVGKKDKVKNCTFNQFWANGDRYYELSGTGTLTVQGTSSVDYLLGAANTDISFDTLVDGNGRDLMANGVVDEDHYGKNYFVGENDEVTVFTIDANTTLTSDCIIVERDVNGEPTKYIKALGYKINDDSTPITYSNTKVNFASCEQVNNMCNAAWYQRYQPYQSLTPRDCMEFAMGVQFIKDSGTVPDNDHFVLFGDDKYHLYSIANMGTSKKNVHVFHDLSNPLECCIEVGNNLNDLCRMVTDDMSGSIWFGGSDKSFESRYPDTDTPPQAITNAWQRFLSWMAASNPNAATNQALPQSETYGIYTFQGHDRGGTQVLKGTRVTQYAGTYTHDTFERRMAKMLSECEDYLVMDSVIYHFVYLERHTMCDNVAKNSFWSSSDGLHWDLSKAYDMDTSDGNNNEGQMVFDYGYEADDVLGSKSVFNANDAVWFVFASNLYEACQTMFINREAAGAWSSVAYHNFLLEQQHKVPERVWVQCYWYDYLRTYEQNINDSWMSFLDGGQKTHQRSHYEYFEEIYDSSKYRGTSCTVQNVNFRGYYPSKWEGITNELWQQLLPQAQIDLKMYNKCYINVSIDGTIYSQKANRGQTYTIDFSQQSKLNDTVINIYSAQMILEIGDISRLYPGTPNFANATRLRSLTVGSSTDGYMNSNLTDITFGNNTMLEYLYVQNLGYVTGNLGLTNCQSLLYLDASGSSFAGYEFATGGLLQTAYLEQPKSLLMKNLYYLEDENFHVADYSELNTLVLEGCPEVDSLAIVNAATGLESVRLVGIDWTLSTTDVLNRMLTIQGRDEGIHVIPTSVLSGDVYVSGLIRNQELIRYDNAWPNLTVTYDPNNLVQKHLITYVNADENSTVLYQTYVDQGALPPDPYALGLIEKPTLASTEQYTFDFGTTEDDEYVVGSGWDDIQTVVSTPRTITAVYSHTIRTYTVRWYGRAGLLLKELNNITYGSEVEYGLDSPTYTDGEMNNIYRLFKGWDKSTGFIKEDLDVYAIWDSVYSLPSTSLAMCDMTTPQIYGICQANRAGDYWDTDSSDYIDITLGHDFEFTNVNSTEIGTDVLLTGINVDQYVSGGYYFNGAKAYTTNIKLFDEDSPAFTMAIDFQFSDSVASDSTLVSTYSNRQSQGEGFRIYSTNGIVRLEWGNSSTIIGRGKYRDMVVLRHPKDSRYLYVYSAGNTDTTYADSVTRSNLVRETTTTTSEPLTFGGIHFADGYRNYGTGHIHWCKIWYDDLGDKNAMKLASWPHEKVRMEYWGTNKYYQYGTARTTGASFVCNRILGGVTGRNYVMDTEYYSHGWPSSEMRTFLGGRVFNAMPEEWQAIIKAVEINTKAEYSDSNVTTTSDKLYLYSYKEIVGSTSDFYAGEIGTTADPIPWLASANSRTKFKGKNRTYSLASIYQCSSEPSELYTTDIAPGSIWVNTSSSSLSYIFVPSGELTEYGITPDVAVDNDYAHGGWVTASSWWTRSIYSWSSESQLFVYVTPNGNYGYASPNQGDGAGVVFGFSI